MKNIVTILDLVMDNSPKLKMGLGGAVLLYTLFKGVRKT